MPEYTRTVPRSDAGIAAFSWAALVRRSMVDDEDARDDAMDGVELADGADESDGFDVARTEREAMYPMTGYALVRVEYQEPPGEALTEVAHYGRLGAVELPDRAPMTAYVVYDADGNAYRREDVEAERA